MLTEPIKILIVDDESKNLTVLESLIDDNEYTLIRAQTADEALLALIEHEFALLILDVHMPDMSGFELAKLIKQRRKSASIPIIFLTAYFNESQHVLEGYGTGAVDYLLKPINPEILRSKINIFAELYNQKRQLENSNLVLVSEVNYRQAIEDQLRELNETLEHRVSQRTEELLQADRRKDEFLATLAHELRNPLSPVCNAVYLLNERLPADPELRWAGEVIDRQVRQMIRLVDDLMDISRINQGKIELKRDEISLEQVLRLAVESCTPLIEQFEQTLTVSIPPTPILLYADATRLTQVVLNLINNAAKFSRPGGQIRLEARTEAGHVRIDVHDSGIGIPNEKLTSIFEMFTQVEPTLERTRGGLGIGLSLAKRLVELHGGQISASSDGLGLGSTFTITLPIEVKSSRSIPSRTSTAGSKAFTAKRILVVDDNEDAARTLSLLLQCVGHEIYLAFDGPTALEVAQREQPDTILLDIGLPKLNGYEVAKSIRNEHWGQSILMIAMTGWGQDQDRLRALEVGFDHHTTKPVEVSYLLELISRSEANPLEC